MKRRIIRTFTAILLMIVAIAGFMPYASKQVKAEPATKQIIFDEDTVKSINTDLTYSFSKEGITLSPDCDYSYQFEEGGGAFAYFGGKELLICHGSFTFSSSIGKISKIEIECRSAYNVPSGWTFASDAIFHSLKKELENRSIQRPAKELSEGGVIGFNARMSGWMEDDVVKDKDVNTYFWACEKKNDQNNYGNLLYTTHFYLILRKETGNIEVEMNPNTGLRRYHSVRLIQEIQWK